MQATDVNEILVRIYSDVAKRMAFMFSESAGMDELPRYVTRPLLAHISFDGPVEGTLALVVPAAMCPEIAANTLGIENDDPAAEAHGIDALKELLNVVCGNVVLELAGPDQLYELTPPEVVEIDQEGWKKLQADDQCVAFIVDDHPALLRLAFHRN